MGEAGKRSLRLGRVDPYLTRLAGHLARGGRLHAALDLPEDDDLVVRVQPHGEVVVGDFPPLVLLGRTVAEAKAFLRRAAVHRGHAPRNWVAPDRGRGA